MKHSREVLQFRKECSAWYYYQSQVKKAEDKLTEIQVRLDAVYSPALEKIGSTPTPHEKDLIGLLSKKDEVERDKQFYIEKMRYIKGTIEKISSPAYRITSWMALIDGVPFTEVGKKFDVSPRIIMDTQDKFLNAVLKKESNTEK